MVQLIFTQRGFSLDDGDLVNHEMNQLALIEECQLVDTVDSTG